MMKHIKLPPVIGILVNMTFEQWSKILEFLILILIITFVVVMGYEFGSIVHRLTNQ